MHHAETRRCKCSRTALQSQEVQKVGFPGHLDKLQEQADTLDRLCGANGGPRLLSRLAKKATFDAARSLPLSAMSTFARPR